MKFIQNILKGAVIGVANIIPGVSGGTMMVSMGIYDKLISSITHLKKQFKESVFFLLPILIGMALGIVGLSFVLQPALEYYPLQTSTLFIGLVLGGLPAIIKPVRGHKINLIHVILFIIFFAMVLMMSFMNASEGVTTDLDITIWNMVQLLLVGIVSAASMIIPGVSGSLVMMVLGFYNIILGNISAFISSLVHFDIPGLIHGFGIFIPFGIGVFLGIGIIAKLIEMLFAKFPVPTYWAIIGLICASPIAILYEVGIKGLGVITILVSIVTFAIGFIISQLLGKDHQEA